MNDTLVIKAGRINSLVVEFLKIVEKNDFEEARKAFNIAEALLMDVLKNKEAAKYEDLLRQHSQHNIGVAPTVTQTPFGHQ